MANHNDKNRNNPGQPPGPDRTIFRQGDKTQAHPKAGPQNPTGHNEQTRVRPPNQPPQQNSTRVRAQPGNNAGAKPPSNNSVSGEHLQVLKGRFILEKVLGVGGMGVVYKAKDRNKIEAHDRDPYVAIKVLSDEFRAHPESFIALQRESRKGQRIAHPNVVKVYDFDRDGDTVFMTMEYLEGRPLDQLIKQYSSTGLPKDDIRHIVNDICSALTQAHSENIVHSDLKPGNIFVTDSGVAKIFDFGIARAVANIDRHSGKTQDKTVFDAGSLGALTPAYASLEMLQGKQPDVRDDIYALGCIVYEMLAGEHPFNRIPADEAYKRKLKPRRISGVKTRQWKAIEKALAFHRQDRIASAHEFQREFAMKKTQSILFIGVALTVLVLLGAIGYLLFSRNTGNPIPPQPTVKLDELEFKIKYDIFKQKIDKLLMDPTFTAIWENDIWDEVKGMTALLNNQPDAYLNSVLDKLTELYLKKIREVIDRREYSRAQALIENAYRFARDRKAIDAEKSRLAELMQQDQARKVQQSDDKTKQDADKQAKEAERRRIMTQFELAQRNVKDQLECKARLNMRDFGIAIEKLRQLDMARYAQLENGFVVSLAECITEVAKTNPESASESKSYALRIFPNNAILNGLKITARDACDVSMAGLGARGDRSACRDRIQGFGSGPVMVVIPGNGPIAAFAIGKYEISNREFKQFCASSHECGKLSTDDDNLPVTNVSIDQIKGYLKWLSKTTNQKYRLPTHAEWSYAANANTRSHDPNRNCQLNTRGIEKGGQLVRINTGAQNSWGVVNYLGNAQELVYEKDFTLSAMGGSFEDPMEKCDVKLAKPHSGRADGLTGFRVIRELTNR